MCPSTTPLSTRGCCRRRGDGWRRVAKSPGKVAKSPASTADPTLTSGAGFLPSHAGGRRFKCCIVHHLPPLWTRRFFILTGSSGHSLGSSVTVCRVPGRAPTGASASRRGLTGFVAPAPIRQRRLAQLGRRIPPQRVGDAIRLPDRHQEPLAPPTGTGRYSIEQPRQEGMRSVRPGSHPCGRRCSARRRVTGTSRPQVQQARVGRRRPSAAVGVDPDRRRHSYG